MAEVATTVPEKMESEETPKATEPAKETVKTPDEKPTSEVPESVAVEAVNMLAQGKRNMLVGEIPQACNQLQEACRLLAKKYGETSDECAEAYLTYGKALLELSRMESGVLGNALQGIDEDEDKTSQSSDDKTEESDKMTEEDKEKLSEDIIDAMTEREGEGKLLNGKKEEVKENGVAAQSGDTKTEEPPKTEDKKAEEPTKTTDTKSDDKKAEESAKAEDKKAEDTTKADDKKAEETTKAEDKKAEETTKPEDKKAEETTKVEEKTPEETTTVEGKKAEETTKAVDKKAEDTTKVEDKKEEDSTNTEKTKTDVKETVEEAMETEETKEEVTDTKETKNKEEKKEGADKKEDESEDKETEDDAAESEDIGEEEGEGTEGEGTEGEASAEEGKEGESKKEDEDDVSNLQLSWEMLELAKKIYARAESKEMKLKNAECHLKLGEVGLETEQYEQAIGDLKSCLAIQKEMLEPEDRCIAETYYQLGLACTYNAEYDNAVANYKGAAEVIKAKIAKLTKVVEDAEASSKGKETASFDDPVVMAQKEVKELQDILPDIMGKLEDVEDERKSSDKVKQMMKESLASELGSAFAAAEGSKPEATDKPVSDITHLVRKKRKPEEEAEDSAKKAKVENGSGDGSTNGAAVNGNGTASPEKNQEIKPKTVDDVKMQTDAAEASS